MFYSSASVPLNPSRSAMLDPFSDSNHPEFQPMPSSLLAAAANGADTTTSSFDDNALINNFMPNSPSLSAISNSTAALNTSTAQSSTAAGSHSYPTSGLNMNAGNSYLNYGLSLDQSLNQQHSASAAASQHQPYHQETTPTTSSHLNDSQSQFFSGVNTRLLNNDYYSSNEVFHNNNSHTDSSLLSTGSINFLDSDLSFAASNSMPTSAASLPTPTSNYFNPLQTSSFDINHQQHQHQQQYDFTPVARNQPAYNDYNYYAQSLPHQLQFQHAHSSQQLLANNNSFVKRETPDVDFYEPQVSETGKKRYRVIRGVSAGGCTTRPPKQSIDSDSVFLPVQLNLHGASVEEICYPKWSSGEKQDRRRIIRIERIQSGPKLIANFSIVGSANEHPVTVPPGPDVDVVEVSCLECSVKPNDDYDSQSSDDEKDGGAMAQSGMNTNYIKGEDDGEHHQYYITSVEVVEIVELLIGTQLKDPAERRRERGRVRSNLVPFWSKKSISSRMDSSYGNGNGSPVPSSPTNQDYRVELAKRIMGYEIRKPRGFDKDVRILRWDKLVPALKRALQSYYTEIPLCDSRLEF